MMAFTVWLLLGGSVAYWGLQLLARPLPMPESVTPAGELRAAQVDLGRLLGVTAAEAAPEPETQSVRLRLLGVVAPKNASAAESGEGLALIEVDGVARTVRVGAVVDGELRLVRVDARSASLGRVGQAPSQVLQISPPAAPSTGSLPPATPSPVVLGGNPPGMNVGPPARTPLPAPVPGVSPSVYGMPLAASASNPQE
ncbi:type II secretion system protein N [Roseateles saccharophilus]|uniref:General secretion pathway protein C n=2 Tax=Roseateles saccharophilus TaxID=304 RepID=A0A4R3UL18_ROSSA|nr:general secretion pathway protein C [Roseateles saccharophilus]